MARFVMIIMVLAVVLLKCAAPQTVHVVGDSKGWVVPTNDEAFETWAAEQKFFVGDILTFNFVRGSHNVQEVPKESFDECTAPNSMENKIMSSPKNITLNSDGEHYYICTFGQNCQNGQKLAIHVSAAPSPNYAHDGVLASVFVSMMVAVMGLFF